MRFSKLALMAISAGLALTGTANATPIGSNIVVNGGAEAGTGSASGNDVLAIPGWTTTSNFTVVDYGAPGGFPDATVATSIGGGNQFFAGGVNTALSSASQVINVSDLAASIDASLLSITLSAYLGGFDGQSDNMTLMATFLDASVTSIGSLLIGPVTEGDRAGVSTLLFRSADAAIPDGTRAISLELLATRIDGAYDDGYADDISLVVSGASTSPTGVPEPSSLALLVSSLAFLGFLRRRQEKSSRAT